jgi:cytosine/adenosine deaminase-related metal-dependent hydrolase
MPSAVQLLTAIAASPFSGTDCWRVFRHMHPIPCRIFFRELRDLAAEKSLPLMTHLSESREELTFLFDSSGPIAEKLYPFVDWNEYLPPARRTTSTAYLDSLEILSTATTVVHCVHITPSEAELLKKRESPWCSVPAAMRNWTWEQPRCIS